MNFKSRIKEFVLNCSEPTVILNAINDWKILSYTLSDWENVFQNRNLSFRCGPLHRFQKEPLWESQCQVKEMSFKEFEECAGDENNKEWLYFDYKYLKDYINQENHLDVKWKDFGFDNISELDSTIWIGSKGAHTPCHMDTYGCNIVCQIYRRKLWFLIPPAETPSMGPIRVPYEESSVYSSINFHTPNDRLHDIKKLYKVILEPGDVLIVPQHWWHYVENLELAISINTWIPLEDDNNIRIQEFLVRTFVYNICQNFDIESAKQLLNPNEYQLLDEEINYNLLDVLIKNRRDKQNKTAAIETPGMLSRTVQLCDRMDIQNYIEERRKLADDLTSSKTKKLQTDPSLEYCKCIINAFCHPDTVKVAVDNLLRNLPTDDETRNKT